MFISDIGNNFLFSGFGVRLMLVLFNEFESVFFFAVVVCLLLERISEGLVFIL